MFVVTGAYQVKPGTRDDFLKEVYDQGIYAEFLKEEGNISYDYYYPYRNETDIFFVERWETPEAWDAHKVAPHTARLQPIKDKYMTGFVPGFFGEIKE
ncbi:MAG: antibiotic biosynthesis monooxygenase [Oscillospiraceae bacterium]|nr:antibiotic biosynthesis monooxygenase [Oscillospiraceae bacterium]